MVGNESDANDLAQETFVRVYQHRTGFRPGAKFKSWLFTIAANLARNHHRWQSRHPAHSIDAESTPGGQTLAEVLPSPHATPEEAVLANERSRAVHAALLQLPGDMREALVLCEWEELSVAQAAQVLKTTPKSVESRLYRARNLLRESLKKWLQAI
jgi:RNA polymerase sigma-70 factor (ECF subfamily)